MLFLILLLYGLPVYLVFFRYKLIPLTAFWKWFLWLPPIVAIQDHHPDQPLRVGMTGRITVFAGGGFPIVNQLAPILHTVFSWLDFLYPKPSLLVVLLGIAAIVGLVLRKNIVDLIWVKS
ncbi:MAG: hypothetical protein MUC83_00330 [Pirellula sp.]|jgi:hypothetical protein|nr:hypothetical protein [Pirellula sp.]